jgi:hypothetical protein
LPALRPLTEVARYDAKLFADVVAPAISAAGFAGVVALAPDEGDIVIAASDADLDALFAGRQKTELNALEKLRGAPPSSLAIRGSAAALAELVAALSPKKHAAPSLHRTREIGAEAGAQFRGRSADRVKRNGRYIKGIRPGGRTRTASTASSASSSASSSAWVEASSVPADRVQFALSNLRNFIEAALRKTAATTSAGDDDWMTLVITPGEVRRE